MLYNHIRLQRLGKYGSVSFKASCFQGYPSYTFNFDGERPRIRLSEIKFTKENTEEFIADTAINDYSRFLGKLKKENGK